MVNKILVVDNFAFMRNLLKQLLRGEHEVVSEAENGVEVVGLYCELEPNVITMDVVVPIRDDTEATSETRSLDAGASVIMCTSVGREEKMCEVVKMEADGHITKSFQKPNVLQAIVDMIQAEA